MKERPLLLLMTDFSDAARTAYATATALAERLGGRLLLVHVVQELQPTLYAPPVTTTPLPTDPSEHVAAAERSLRQEIERLPDRRRAESCVLVGDNVARKVIERAHESEADFIVLASHGRTGLRRALLGSVAEDVMRTGDVPLLVVPSKS